MHEVFRKFAQKVSDITGSVGAFALAFAVIVVWGLSGPIFQFSDTWQLVINTGTTIVTFLMVFLIQNTQNRESRAIHAKLDELILKISAADNHLLEAEDLSDEELKDLRGHYMSMAAKVSKHVHSRAGREDEEEVEQEEEDAAEGDEDDSDAHSSSTGESESNGGGRRPRRPTRASRR